MDVEQLHIVLQQSFSPDGSLRVPAEETVRNLKHVKGATTLLLQVAAEKQVSFCVYHFWGKVLHAFTVIDFTCQINKKEKLDPPA